MKWMKQIAILWIVLLSACSEQAVTEASTIDDLMSEGGALMVVQDGQIVHQNGYGLADVETGKPTTAGTVFHLGSVGKQFTAMGIMILSEQGLINYDDPLSVYLPELNWMDDAVTIRSLLYHTSGVMGYDDSDILYEALLDTAEMPGNDDLLNVIAEQGDMLFEPGEQFSYSNTGYDLLGVVIERVSGQNYPTFMNEAIFQPLNMEHTFALPNDDRLSAPQVAKSYSIEGAYEPDVLDRLSGAGSIYSTLGDLYLYDQALENYQLVSQNTLAEAFSTGVLNNGEETGYGFGVEVGEYAGETYIGHSGAWLGFESYYLRIPEQRLSVIVLLNFDYSESGAEGIAFSAADIFLR